MSWRAWFVAIVLMGIAGACAPGPAATDGDDGADLHGEEAAAPDAPGETAMDLAADPGPDDRGDDGVPDDRGDGETPGETTGTDSQDQGNDSQDQGTDGDGAADAGCAGPLDCPGGVCHPERHECVECVTSDDCAPGDTCDADHCVTWVCLPGSKSCDGPYLMTCTWDGQGYESSVECDDHDACTTGDGCSGNRCLEVAPLDCDDGDPCTGDSCDPAAGCVHVPAEGAPCDDGDPCTLDDHCEDGECVPGDWDACDDGNPCTGDLCTSVMGCVHLVVAGSCDDGNPCTTGDACSLGACGGAAVPCDDGVACTLDACDPSTGVCAHVPDPACTQCSGDGECDDANPCTDDACTGGFCGHSPAATAGCCAGDADCDDGDPCTSDRCGTWSGCRHAPAPDPACCEPSVLSASFDGGGSAAFTLDPAAGGVGWSIVQSQRASSPPSALYFGNPATWTYDNGATPAGEAASPWLTLPAGVRLDLAFTTWQDVETSPGHDALRVLVRSPGQEWEVWRRPEGFPMKTAVQVPLDVTGLGGRTVRVVFAFDAGDPVANGGEGVYVDDVSLSSPCQPKACKAGLDCTSVGFHAACASGACDFSQSLAFVAAFGSPGSLPGQYSTPTGLAVSTDGLVYVGDRYNGRVQVLAPDGKPAASIGTQGLGQGQLLEPHGVAAGFDRVLVADTGNDRVSVFTTAGVFLFAFGAGGPDPAHLLQPRDVAIGAGGATYFVADTGNHRVAVFDVQGGFLFSFGQYGKLDGNFRTPSCVVTAPDGSIRVCDTQNNRIQAFAPDGTWQASIKPVAPEYLNGPMGASVGPDGLLAVSDSASHRVVLLDADGALQDAFGTWGAALGQLDFPLGLAWTPDGRLLVADSGNGRIAVLEGLPPSW
jgi:DNA-binding beta-propeller fold protein YncE